LRGVTAPSEHPAARRRSGPWWRTRTLLGRLTVGMLTVLLIACAVLGISTELFVRSSLLHQIDQELGAAGGRYSASLEHEGSPPVSVDGDGDESVPGQAVGTLGVRIVDGAVTDAAVVTEAGTNRRLDLSEDNAALVGSVVPGASPKSLDLEGVGDYRVTALQGRDGDIQLTGLPLSAMNQTLARLFVVEASLFILVFLAGGGAAALVVRRNLRPLQQLTTTALDISEQELTDPETSLPTEVPLSEAGSEVDQLNIAFHRMLDRVRQALTVRDETEVQLRQFVADASHELRTPLANIRAHAEFAATGPDPLPEAASTALARITTAADRMSTLVEDLLLLARLDAGRPLVSEPVDLTRLVLDAVADARTAAPDHRWQLDLPEHPIIVTGDEERLHQVLANLLTNASTHTPPGTTVVIRLAVQEMTTDLTVADNGPGIPTDQLPRLFDRFARGDTSRSRAHGSSGLGLAIAHSIVAAHDGSLTATSPPGAGATFQVRLPS
jgi:two-component system, OmpR family, sensor kinase